MFYSQLKSLAVTSAVVLGLSISASAVTRTWSGANIGRTTNWTGGGGQNSAGNNWVGGTAPAGGDDLVFAGTTGLTSTNNTTANTSYLGITFSSTAGAFVLGGNAITLTAGVTNSSTSTQTLNMNLILGATRTFNAAAGNLALGGVVSGAGGLTKSGTSILTLSGTNTYTGATTIAAGTLQIGAGGTTGALSASSAITNNSALSFNRSNTITQGTNFGTISGTGSLTQAGSGILILSSANTYTGATTISAGTLQIGGGGTTGALSASSAITNNSALSFNRSNTITQGTDFGSISGTGSVTKAGSGTLVLGSANSYGGATSVNSGILRVTDAAGLGTTGAGTTVASGAALELSGGITIGAESLSLAGTGIASGGALRSVSGNNTYGGAITSAVASSITADADVLTLNGLITSSSTTTFGGAGSHVAAGGIAGSGTIIKTGAGTLTLSTGNSQANTTVNQGQLNVNHLAALGTPAGTLTMAAGTFLDNTSGASVTVTNPKSISLGSSMTFIGSNNLDLGEGTVALSGNTEINVSANQLTFSGDVTGNNFGITKTGSGTLRLDGLNGPGSFSGNSFVNAGTLVIGGTSELGGGSSTVLTVADGAFLQVDATASTGNVTIVSRPDGLLLSSVIDANQKISGSGSLNTNNAKFNGVTTVASGVTVSSSGNFFGTVPAVPTPGRIVFESNTTLNATAGFTIDPNQGVALDAGSAVFDVSPNQALIVESSVAGSGSVVKTGSGNMRLVGVNTYTGGTTVSSGILGITNGDALGAVSGALKLDGGTLVGAQVTAGELITNVTIASGRSVVLANGKTSGMDAQTGLSLRYDGVIGQEVGGGAAAGLRIGSSAARTGTVILGGNNTYTGATTINFGTLSVSNIGNGGVAGNLGASSNAAANLVLGGGTLQYTGATAASDRGFTLSNNTTSSIDVSTSDTTLTISGGSVATSGSVTKTGAGTLRLTGANAHTGATTITGGTLSVSDIGNGGVAGNLGASSSAAANLVLGGGTLQYTGATAASDRGFTLSNSTSNSIDVATSDTTLTMSGGSAATTGSLTKIGAGTLRLTGANAHTGATTIAGGTLSVSDIGDGGVAGNLGASSSAAANLVLGGGTLQYTGATAASDRAFTLSNSTSNSIDVATSDTTLTMSGGSAATTGSLTKIGAGILRLTGANAHTGATTVAGGTLSVSDIGDGGVAGNLGASSSAAANLVLSGGTLQYTGATAASDRGFTLTNSTSSSIDVPTLETVLTLSGGSAATSGALTKTGAGTLRLTGANSHTGATTVAGGKLVVNGSTAAESAVAVSNGAALGGSGTIGGNTTISSGAALAPGNSPGVLTVAGTTTLESGSIFEWELDTAQSSPETNRGVAYDGLNTDALAGTGAIFKIILTGTQDFSDSFWSQTRTWTDIFKSADGSTTLSGWASVFSGGFQYSYNSTTIAPTRGSFTITDNSLTWSVIPEPTNALAGLLAASALLRRRRQAWI